MQENHIYIQITEDQVLGLCQCYESICKNYTAQWCDICGHSFCPKHRYRYDFLVLWGSLWKESGYPPVMDLCQECCKAMQEAKIYLQILKEKGGKRREAGYFIIKSHLEKLETASLRMLLKDNKAFKAKADYFYNGVFSVKPIYYPIIRKWMVGIVQDILVERKEN